MNTKKDITMIIADDHPLLLKGLYEELTDNGYNVIGKATNGTEALSLILTLKPELALLDIDMPVLTGFDVIKMARVKGSKTKFIILSFHKETAYIAQFRSLDIQGYLLKEDSFSELENCINTILIGREYSSPSIDTFSLQNASEELRKLKRLTPSEITILKLVSCQESTAAIANSLNISSRTIEKHRSNIIAKLDLEKVSNSLSNWAMTNKNIIMEL